MLPDNEQSEIPVPSPFWGAAAMQSGRLYCHRDGGIALNDPSKGLLYQVWYGEVINGSDIVISAPNYPATVHYSGENITDFSFAFDQNMRLSFVYTENDEVFLRWYDSVQQQMVTDSFGSAPAFPHLDLDDKRSAQLDISDLIFAYIIGGEMRYRQQRDRFQIEYVFDEGPWVSLDKIGMGINYRFQFEGTRP